MMKRNSVVRSGKLENQVIAAFDIGGTNTRVQVIQENNLSIDIPLEKDIFKLHISSKDKLKKLIQELVFIRWKKLPAAWVQPEKGILYFFLDKSAGSLLTLNKNFVIS